MDNLEEYFKGEKLYGDDFSIEQIIEWYKDEENGYFSLYGKNKYRNYPYHLLNYEYGFRYLPIKIFNNVLSLGGAYADELDPIRNRISRITVLDSAADKYAENNKGSFISYIKANPNGELPFSDNCFDLITCFGTLHHIPNVSKVIKEIYRCTMREGYVIIREPIVSMGDWRKERKGLTKRERGIPLNIFRKIISDSGFEVISEKKCVFSLTSRLQYFIKKPVYNSKIGLLLDRFFCMLFYWNNRYHTTNLFLKLRATSISYVLIKR
jgi:SAM-dependent methyltransferase